MRNIIKKILKEERILEALKPSQYRKYVKEFDKSRYESFFKELGDKYSHDKNYYRIYIPLSEIGDKPEFISDTHRLVKSFLESKDFEDIDYIKGQAKYIGAKNISSIGKILQKFNPELLKAFISDEKRKSVTSNELDDLLVVLSRHPYDIAGSDTDRSWTNCMTMAHPEGEKTKELVKQYNELKDKLDPINKNPGLENKLNTLKQQIKDRKEDGGNQKYLIHEVKEGSLISYLINKNDKNINKPLAVLNIKPYINSADQSDFILLSSNSMYGNGRTEFKKTVDNVLDVFNGERTEGLFCLNRNVYNDNDQSVIDFNLINKMKSLLKKKSINGNLNLRGTNISDLGQLKHVGGYLDLRNTSISKKYSEQEIRKMVNVVGNVYL